MRIVVDTNVLYSALKSMRGASYRLISQLPCNTFQIILSVPLYVEYQEVLLKGNLLERYSKQEILGFLRYFCKICIHQEIFYLWRPVLKDQKDDMILELAVAGDCDYIVIHNIKHFKDLEQFKSKPITPKEFIGLQGDLL